jgi:hypothetical protein
MRGGLVEGLGCRGVRFAVFEVQQPHPVPQLPQKQHRIAPGLGDPVDIQLERYQVRVRLLEQDVEARGPLQILEFVVMVVVRKAHAMALAEPAPLVERGGCLAVALGRAPLRLRQHWTYHPLQSQLARVWNPRDEVLVVEMAARRGEPGTAGDGGQLPGGVPIHPAEVLDLVVADRSNPPEDGEQVRVRDEASNRVELHTQRHAPSRAQRQGGRRGRSQCQKLSPIQHRVRPS